MADHANSTSTSSRTSQRGDSRPVEPGEVTCLVSALAIQNVSDSIDKKGGLLAKAHAAKHLSEMLLNELSKSLDPARGAKGQIDGMLNFTLSERHLDTLHWLYAEVWELNQDLAADIDALQDDFVEFANASYAARKA